MGVQKPDFYENQTYSGVGGLYGNQPGAFKSNDPNFKYAPVTLPTPVDWTRAYAWKTQTGEFPTLNPNSMANEDDFLLPDMDAVIDQYGFSRGGLPNQFIAPDVQFLAERWAARRRQQLFGRARGVGRQAIGTMEAYRPGGAAAMTAGLYGNLQNAFMTEAMNTQAPDHMFRYDEWQDRRREKQAEKLQTLNAIFGGISAIGSLVPGGGGGNTQQDTTPAAGPVGSGSSAPGAPLGGGGTSSASGMSGWGAGGGGGAMGAQSGDAGGAGQAGGAGGGVPMQAMSGGSQPAAGGGGGGAMGAAAGGGAAGGPAGAPSGGTMGGLAGMAGMGGMPPASRAGHAGDGLTMPMAARAPVIGSMLPDELLYAKVWAQTFDNGAEPTLGEIGNDQIDALLVGASSGLEPNWMGSEGGGY